MNRFIQRLSKIPVKMFLLIYIVLYIVLAFVSLSLNVEKNSPAAFALAIPVIFSSVMLFVRYMIYLKAKDSVFYYFNKFFLSCAVCAFPVVILIILDNNLDLGGFLWMPGIIFEAGLLIWLLVRYFMKQWRKEHPIKEATGSSYSFERLCGDFSDGREIEFTYDNTRYLFIPENGRYYFKRIVSIDPYEYEILAEAGNALVCIDASSVNGKKMTGLWPEIENITVY
jgi:hypothetical protein